MTNLEQQIDRTMGPRERQLLRAREQELGFVDLDRVQLSMDRWNLDEAFYREWSVLPIREKTNIVYLAALDLLDEASRKHLADRFGGKRVVEVLAEENDLRKHIENRFAVRDLPSQISQKWRRI